MKKKFLLIIALMGLAIGYSCQEDSSFGIPEKKSKETRIGNKLSTEYARNYLKGNLDLISLPSKEKEDECNDSDCKLHGHEFTTNDSLYHESDSCAWNKTSRTHSHQKDTSSYKPRSALPKLKKSNFSPDWENIRKWSDNQKYYIEIPLTTNDKLYALKRWWKNEEKTNFERSAITCMLVFEQALNDTLSAPDCYMVTLIGTKQYLKRNKEHIKTLRHKPNDNTFTGFVYKSSLKGRIMQGYYYTDGNITHKVFRKSVFSETSLPENATFYNLEIVNLSSAPISYSSDWEDEMIECGICGEKHPQNELCEVVVTYCSKCGRPADECECCWQCGQYPCQCCDECWNYPCICCPKCHYAFCRCCTTCGNYPCTCQYLCPECGYDPCICCPQCHKYPCECAPIPDDCDGPKCSVCGGLIQDGLQTRSVISCPICQSTKCPYCGKRHCTQVHEDCDEIPNAQAIKNAVKATYNHMLNAEKYGNSYIFSDFTDFIASNSQNENGMTLNYYEDEDRYLLKNLTKGNSPYENSFDRNPTTIATIHSHPLNTPPSGSDLINTAKWLKDFDTQACRTNYVYTAKAIYAFHIENETKALAFYSKYSYCQRTEGSTTMFKSGTELATLWDKLLTKYSRYSAEEQYMSALTELLSQTNSGIHLMKKEITDIDFGIHGVKKVDDILIPIKCK